MITFGSKEWVSSLKVIWKDVFHDSDEYIDYFFDTYYKDEDTLVFFADEKPVSMVFMIPYLIRFCGELMPVTYIYAAATLPEYRGKGYMEELLKESFEKGQSRGDVFSVLIPAEPSLYGYYSKFGYAEAFSSYHLKMSAENLSYLTQNQCYLTNVSVSSEIYEIYLKVTGVRERQILLDEKKFTLFFQEQMRSGTEIFKISKQEAEIGYFLCDKKAEKVIVPIIDFYNVELSSILAEISKVYPGFDIEMTLPTFIKMSEFQTEEKPVGMARVLDASRLLEALSSEYQNLALEFQLDDRNYKISGGNVSGGNIVSCKINQNDFSRLVMGYRLSELLLPKEFNELKVLLDDCRPAMNMTLS